tara:strand:- start:353 stop:907 length:555 start_codon:yes stop_codon:yes gene_type:complete
VTIFKKIEIEFKNREKYNMVQTKEERAAYCRAYRQSPAGKKSNRITHWKQSGIIVPDNDFDKFYDEYLSVEICQKKVSCNGAKLTYDKLTTITTKMVDHDHNITDKPNVRFICCHVCNQNDRVNNTSGEPNIRKTKNRWMFSKMVKGIRYYSPESYENIDDAINFKIKWLSDFKNGLVPSEFIV